VAHLRAKAPLQWVAAETANPDAREDEAQYSKATRPRRVAKLPAVHDIGSVPTFVHQYAFPSVQFSEVLVMKV
jgi:hypothetical protein